MSIAGFSCSARQAIGPRSFNASRQCLHYSALKPLRSLQRVIEHSAPDLIVPCDDRAVRHVHLLHEMTANPEVRARLGRSLGSPEMFAVTEGRHDLMALARRHGVPVPDTTVINSVSDLTGLA